MLHTHALCYVMTVAAHLPPGRSQIQSGTHLVSRGVEEVLHHCSLCSVKDAPFDGRCSWPLSDTSGLEDTATDIDCHRPSTLQELWGTSLPNPLEGGTRQLSHPHSPLLCICGSVAGVQGPRSSCDSAALAPGIETAGSGTLAARVGERQTQHLCLSLDSHPGFGILLTLNPHDSTIQREREGRESCMI